MDRPRPSTRWLPNDLSFYEQLNAIVQEEPIESLDPERRGILASIGIVKGQAFEPDARMKKILEEAAAIGNATARAIVWQPRVAGAHIYPDSDSSWVMAYAGKDVFFEVDGATNLDARTMFYYAYTAVTPAMAVTRPGAGSDYGILYLDSSRQHLDGGEDLPSPSAAGRSSQQLLGCDHLRQPEPIHAADKSVVSDCR